MPSAGLQPLCYTRGYDMCVAILLPSREKTAFLCVFFDCFAYLFYEVIIMKEHAEFKDGKMYLEYDHGQIIFSDQRTLKIVNDQSMEEFYDLVQFWLVQQA